MYPGSFFWKRIGDKWLVGKPAAALFAFSSVVITAVTYVGITNIMIRDTGLLNNVAWGIIGVTCGLSILFVWGGMWSYWIRIDSSGKATRVTWFLLLVIGLWYGAILYYAFVYLPNNGKEKLKIG
jgi:hypothetical protein